LPTGETIDEKLGSITDSLNKFEKYFAENKTLSNKKTYNEVTNKLKQKSYCSLC
jgi:hypothetical protein